MCLCAILAVSDIHSLKLTIRTSHLKIGLNPKRKVYRFPTIRCYRCELLVSGRVYTIVHTVDGSEIQPAPVEVGRLSQYLQGFRHPKGGWEWDF